MKYTFSSHIKIFIDANLIEHKYSFEDFKLYFLLVLYILNYFMYFFYLEKPSRKENEYRPTSPDQTNNFPDLSDLCYNFLNYKFNHFEIVFGVKMTK